MSEHIELEEEEFDAKFNGQTIRRLIGLLRPYALWVIGFLATVMMVSGLDSYFTYLSARMVDEGIDVDPASAAAAEADDLPDFLSGDGEDDPADEEEEQHMVAAE